MTEEEYKDFLSTLNIKCEICNKNPVITTKGGIVDGKRGVFLCCKECKDKIKGTRHYEK